jgi:hypothetical protein
MTTRACLTLTLALVAAASLNSYTPMRAQTGGTDFVMVSSSFSPTHVYATKGKETVITFNQESRVDSVSNVRVGVVDQWVPVGEGKWHFRGPGFASVSGIQIFPVPFVFVLKKFKPCTTVFVIVRRNIVFCVAPNPRAPLAPEVIAFCTFDSEYYGNYRARRVLPESWDYRPSWRRSEAPQGLPATIQMPSQKEAEALLAKPPNLELLNVAPPEMKVTMQELEESVAQEFKFFPSRIEWPSTWPEALQIPEVIAQSGPFTLRATTCGYLLDSKDANPANNCAPSSRATVTIRP